MKIETKIRESLAADWLPSIYAARIRSQRTRSVVLDIRERENSAEIQYTLLGIELKVGKRRFACPDLATARYMRVFARIGCRAFAIPYDITKISTAADDLETAWQRALLLIEEKTSGKQARTVSEERSKVVKAIRCEIIEIGAGDRMPQFDRETRQREA